MSSFSFDPSGSNSPNPTVRCDHCQGTFERAPGSSDQPIVCPHCGGQATTSHEAVPPVNASPPIAAPSVTAGENATNHRSAESGQSGGPAASESPFVVEPELPVRSDRLSIERSLAGGDHDTPTSQLFTRMAEEIGKIFVGQDELVLGSLIALFSSGHVLIESVPGLGKTLFVRTLGRVLGCDFGRIQFTADLMPSDITGAPIFDMKIQEFRFRPGPVFTQILLADEINRSPAKTHAALLEIMQEFRVTVDGKSHALERPFLVMATQNPVESEGTYNLPEAQLDRFMFKLVADYPQAEEEAKILRMHSLQEDINERLESEVSTVTSPQEIMAVTQSNAQVRVADRLLDYVNQLVRLTRRWPQFHMGASPRAGIALMQSIRTLAAFEGRDYAIPDDVVRLALPVLRHRVVLTAEAEVEGHQVDQLLRDLIRSVEVPRL